MKEALAHCLTGPVNLDEQEARERPVDYIHAMAMAQQVTVHRTHHDAHLAALGLSWYALKGANRPDAFQDVLDRLAACLLWSGGRMSRKDRQKIAHQAVMESLVDSCPTCAGTGEIKAYEEIEGTQRMKQCPECGGHGKRRYSNAERIAGLEINPTELVKYERKLSEALGYLAQAEKEVTITALRLMEHWPYK